MHYTTSGVKDITGLNVATTYYVRVCASAAGYADSEWVFFEATTGDSVIELSSPTVTASTTKNSVVLRIVAVENGSKYLVEYSDDPTFETYSTKTFSAGVRTISNLSSDTTYYFRVKAIAPSDEYADSEWTNVSATTKPASLTTSNVVLDAFVGYVEDEFDYFIKTN